MSAETETPSPFSDYFSDTSDSGYASAFEVFQSSFGQNPQGQQDEDAISSEQAEPAQPIVDVTPVPWPDGFSADQLLGMYKAMVDTRAYDERALKLQRSGRIGFCVTSFGEEACQVGTAAALTQEDWLFPSYRQVGAALVRGLPPAMLAANLFGTQEDVVKGRQMPVHYSCRDKRFISISSVIGTQISQAVGCAMAAKIRKEASVTAVYFGDGATSANDFHAGMTFAGVFQPPVLFFCVNNQYAISLPVARQSGNPELWTKGQGYGIPSVRVDGNDLLAVYQATKEAADRARHGGGPTFLELLTYRAGAHSSSDDPTRYRSSDEANRWQKRDPIERFKAKLISWKLWSEEQNETLWTEAREQMTQVTTQAEAVAPPPWSSLFEDVYAEIPAHLAAQRDALMQAEGNLTLNNEGEFPL